MKNDKVSRHPLMLRISTRVALAFIIGLTKVSAEGLPAEDRPPPKAGSFCDGDYDCIGMVIDSGDPILIQMGQEMSRMVSNNEAGTVVKPTEGPIANVRKMLSPANAGLSVVPSDMLNYLERSEEPLMRRAKDYLRFIMTIGRKVVHVIARENIRHLEDLDGKRVVVGPDNTAMWVVSNNLLYLHSVNPSKRLQLKPIEGIVSVMLDRADAAFIIGNAPIPVIERLGVLRRAEAFRLYAERIHLLALNIPESHTEYRPETVHYPGFAEHVNTVAILPTLVSYDFSLKSTPYFERRCRELTQVGSIVSNRLNELRESGHEQWKETSWALEAGNWERDPCFFRKAETVDMYTQLKEVQGKN